MECSSAPVVGVTEDSDSTPMEAAWKMITNQTNFPEISLNVTRCGKPFIFEDPFLIGRECVFHPFAFCVKDNTRENNRAECVNRIDKSLVNISYINQGLRNTFFDSELGPASGTILATGLQQLQQDHESGARKLAAVALSILRATLESLEDSISLDGPWWRKACLAAWHLWKNGRPSMDAAIVSFLLLALGEVSTALSREENEGKVCKRLCVQNALDSVQQMIRSYTPRISQNLASYLLSKNGSSESKRNIFTILTLSSSSTIRECIIQSALASGAPLVNIHVLESRPLFEGVSMAASIISGFEALSIPRPQVRVTIFTDASVAQAAMGVDLFLLGADRIAADGSVSNKTGSLPAALMVRHMAPAAETIVVSEIHKVATESSNEHNVENNEASEVMNAWERNDKTKGLDVVQGHFESDGFGQGRPTVNVQNVYFEWVPPSLINTYICEDGSKTPEDFQRQAQWVSEQCEMYFGIC